MALGGIDIMDDSTSPMARLVEDAVRRLGQLVPPDAATHFINAQREVVLGVTALIQHSSPPAHETPQRRRSSAAAARARRPRRVSVD